MDYKVPGVFVEEVSLLPPSVAAVATGIPAFIGHTQIITDTQGTSLINRPIRITSLLAFTQLFGTGYQPTGYTVQINPTTFNILNVTPNGNRYYLFDAIRHYFDNGGGPCYIVSVGDYTSPVIYGTDTTGLFGGLRALEKVDEPTILAAPDSVTLLNGTDPDFVQCGNFHQAMIAQCARLQDRFAVLDMMQGYLPINDPLGTDPVAAFRDNTGSANLNYAATYYPWVASTYQKAIAFSQLNFVDDAPTPNPVADATLDTMTGDVVMDGLVTELRSRLTEEDNVFGEISTPALNRANYSPLSTYFDALRQAVLTETVDENAASTALGTLLTFVREIALAFPHLQDSGSSSAELLQSLTVREADTTLQAQFTALIAFEKNAGVLGVYPAIGTRVEGDVNTDYNDLDSDDWIGGVTVASIGASGDDYTDGGGFSNLETIHAVTTAPALNTAFSALADAFTSILQDVIFRTHQAERNLFTGHRFFRVVLERVQKEMSLLPPSGAIAGVYATVDRTRGVWKAPANISLRAVSALTYKLTDLEQGTLNIHAGGKSINALRAFTGKGILVWGGRTLAGNDNEWRYINVRRFFTFVEESTKKASEPFVFEPNNANTWVRIRAMIENFLTLQWRQGALAGATTKEAFFVKVGLNETMTAQDILKGRLIVEIGMAAVRPAEFIILRFSHKMQES